jgi:hypothetical protein
MFEALVGGSVLASAAIALFFLRFWQQSRDRLFLIFALAFAVFAVNRRDCLIFCVRGRG